MTLPRRAEAPPSGIPSWARVGQKVVCIDASWVTTFTPSSGLTERAVYTVAAAFVGMAANTGKFIGATVALRLSEVTNREVPDGGFAIERFRPLISKSHDEDIAEFRKLLTSQPVRENERA